ncbi:hypothetical protein [Brasilonema octagenarum]|nr:hypothetical protein [Brasilonema octagenarum]
MSVSMRDIITVYIWFPKEFLGHASMQVGIDTYISFWPNKEIINRSSMQNSQSIINHKNQNINQLLFQHLADIRSTSYEEDCLILGQGDEQRQADCTVELLNLPQEPIKTFWEKFTKENKSYHLIKRNCSSVVAEAINEGWKAYTGTGKNTENISLTDFENQVEYKIQDFEALSFTTAALNFGRLLFWSPKQVLLYAQMVKRLTD